MFHTCMNIAPNPCLDTSYIHTTKSRFTGARHRFSCRNTVRSVIHQPIGNGIHEISVRVETYLILAGPMNPEHVEQTTPLQLLDNTFRDVLPAWGAKASSVCNAQEWLGKTLVAIQSNK